MPTGDGELTFYLGEKVVGYMPDWAKRYLNGMGLSNLKAKQDANGKELPISLVGATIRRDHAGTSHAKTGMILALRNAQPPVSRGSRPDSSEMQVLFRVADGTEPDRVELEYSSGKSLSIRLPRTQRVKQPTIPEKHNNVGGAYLNEGKFELAEKELRLALSYGDSYGHAHANLATVLALTRRWREAVPHFERASSLLPDEELIAFHYAIQLVMHGDMLAANRIVGSFLDKHPKSSMMPIVLGEISKRRGNLSQAYLYFRRARELGAPSYNVEPQLASTLHASRAPIGECIAAYRHALFVIPADNVNVGLLKFRLGILLAITGQRSEARILFRQAVESGIWMERLSARIHLPGVVLRFLATCVALKYRMLGRW
jgi:Flp pilus assembly protein TadD